MESWAWPLVTLILGLAAMLIFRRPLTRFLERAEEMGPKGIRAGSPLAQEVGTAVQPSPADELLRSFDNALLVVRENYIRAELQRLNITQVTERERILIRLLAAVAIVSGFERTYSLIWGSQLGVLQFLNPAGVVATELLRPWYNLGTAMEQDLYRDYTFDQWLSFLQQSLLINRIDDTVEITLEGREFLKYVIHQGYTLSKRG